MNDSLRAQTDVFHEWFEQRRTAHRYRVTQIPLDDVAEWRSEQETGNLVHRTGSFFRVQGLEVDIRAPLSHTWHQPIIVQPETGILGMLVRRVGGVPYLLMQAKMEPGNINTVQLSPTVQATVSNYTRVHGGSAVPYLEHFLTPRRGTIVFDALQTEQGSWFLGKRNRNVIVETIDRVPAGEDFCWLPQDLVLRLLRCDNLVNMDSRTVLSGLPGPAGSRDRPLKSAPELRRWFIEAIARHDRRRRSIALDDVKDWHRTPDEIARDDGRYFKIIGVDVEAGSREITSWSQPMLAPQGRGVIAFVARRIGGVRHLLVQARTSAGAAGAELAPTVQATPANYPTAADRPPFLDLVLDAPGERILFDTVHSEEGGRFYHAENRYLVVDADGEVEPPGRLQDLPSDYIWMTVRQLWRATRIGGTVNVSARNLLACLRCLATGEDGGA